MIQWISHFIASLFGAILTIVYANFAVSGASVIVLYIVFSIICAAQATSNVLSGVLAVKNVKTKLYAVMLCVSVVTTIPVAFAVFSWLAHFCGLGFIPPQR